MFFWLVNKGLSILDPNLFMKTTNTGQLIVAIVCKYYLEIYLFSIDNFVISIFVGLFCGVVVARYCTKRNRDFTMIASIAIAMTKSIYTCGQICILLIVTSRIFIAYLNNNMNILNLGYSFDMHNLNSKDLPYTLECN